MSAGSGGVFAGEFVVAVNVRSGDLDQLFLMPPSVKEWLPEDHLAFFVLDVVSELDLAGSMPPIALMVVVVRCMTR